MARSAPLPLAPPAVALVPGFFGFDHRGETTYFADRFVAGLRSVLEARGFHGIPVVSVSTLGIAGLAQRQSDLLQELRALETATPDGLGRRGLGGRRTWHLVGHSTGGVDAAMLLRDAPLVKSSNGVSYGNAGWGDAASLIDRIGSVVTIAAPHFGTGLAGSPLGEFVAGEPSLSALRDMASATLDVARRGDLASRIRFALSATPGLAKMPGFLLQMTLMNELARDLRPSVVGELSARPVRSAMKDRVFSIATVAPRPTKEHSDKLFRDMWRWTHDGGTQAANVHASSGARSFGAGRWASDLDLRLPSQRTLALDPIDSGDNDGVATTERQAFGHLIGLVIGDHVDVLGRYRRASLVDGKVIDPGLLTSGAEFGDDEFFALLLRIGDCLATTIGR